MNHLTVSNLSATELAGRIRYAILVPPGSPAWHGSRERLATLREWVPLTYAEAVASVGSDPLAGWVPQTAEVDREREEALSCAML